MDACMHAVCSVPLTLPVWPSLGIAVEQLTVGDLGPGLEFLGHVLHGSYRLFAGHVSWQS